MHSWPTGGRQDGIPAPSLTDGETPACPSTEPKCGRARTGAQALGLPGLCSFCTTGQCFLPLASLILLDFHGASEMFLGEYRPHLSGLLGLGRDKVKTCTADPVSFSFHEGGS